MKTIHINENLSSYNIDKKLLIKVGKEIGYSRKELESANPKIMSQVFFTSLIRTVSKNEPINSEFKIQFPEAVGSLTLVCKKWKDGSVKINMEELSNYLEVPKEEMEEMVYTVSSRSERLRAGDLFTHPLVEFKEARVNGEVQEVVNLWGLAVFMVNTILDPSSTIDNGLTAKSRVRALLNKYDSSIDVDDLIYKVEARYIYACHELANLIVQACESQLNK
jgi:hypothetical protein